MQHLYLGIDWGKKFSQVFGFDEDGVIVVEERVPTLSLSAWDALLGRLQCYRVQAGFEVGAHYDWMFDLLKAHGAEVFVIEPAQFAIISKSQRKTDKIDAQKIAEGVRRGDLPLVHVPDAQTRADRRLVAFTHWHSQQSTRLKGKLRSLLLGQRIELACSNITGVKARQWLERDVAPRLSEQEQMFMRHLLVQAELAQRQRKELDALVAARAQTYAQAPIVDSIPGIAELGVLALLSSIAGIARFERPEQLASYFGTCGSVHQSGQRLYLGSITRRGNVHVRWLLSQALQHLHRKDARARKRYLKLKRKKPRGVARAAQVRWLTQIIWHLLTKNQPYRSERAA